jgi:hypothetical protein
MDIKQLKPQKGRFKQGVVHPNSCKKIFESQRDKPIIYRSSYEWRFINWCEHNENVRSWGSECLCIPYVLGNSHHRYYPDFVVEMVTGEVWVVEIKPKSQTEKPKSQSNYAWEQWLKNKEKWRAATTYCSLHNYKFKIFTENVINRLS